MEKTTVYLPADLKRALRRTARRRHVSASALLREAVAQITDKGAGAPSPTVPLFRSKGPSIATGIERELARGFGRR